MPKQTVTEKREETASKAEQLISEAIVLVTDLHTKLDDIRSSLEEKFPNADRYQPLSVIQLEEVVDALHQTTSTLKEAQSSMQRIVPRC